ILETNDDESQDLTQYFQITSDFIAKGLGKGKVLVHCYAGMSRSVTCVCAYLMERDRLSLNEALLLIRRTRYNICPNPSFIGQLVRFEKKCQGKYNNVSLK
ncbi:hypothetical protein GUITHDRAFT_68357, partial [Guillardia theta CCMP2712]